MTTSTDNRVVNSAFELHELNGMSRTAFAAQYKGTKNDIIFLNDGTAHVVVRMDMLCWHGRPGRPLRRLNDIVAIYCGLEEEAYNEENYRKLLRAVYNGRRARVTAIEL